MPGPDSAYGCITTVTVALGDDGRQAAEQGGGAGGEDRAGVAAVHIGAALHTALHISGTVRQGISIVTMMARHEKQQVRNQKF